MLTTFLQAILANKISRSKILAGNINPTKYLDLKSTNDILAENIDHFVRFGKTRYVSEMTAILRHPRENFSKPHPKYETNQIDVLRHL